jgi:hypothetical protein
MIKRSIKGLWRFLKTPLGRRFLGLLLLLALLDDLHYRFVPSKEYKPVCYVKDTKRFDDPSYLDIEGPYSEAFLNSFSGVLDKFGVLHVRYQGKIYTTRKENWGDRWWSNYEGPRSDNPRRKQYNTERAVFLATDLILPRLYSVQPPIEEVWDLIYCAGANRVVPADGDIAALVEAELKAIRKGRMDSMNREFDQRMLKSNPNWCDPPGMC